MHRRQWIRPSIEGALSWLSNQSAPIGTPHRRILTAQQLINTLIGEPRLKLLKLFLATLCAAPLTPALAQHLPMDDKIVSAFAAETNGESAKRNLDRITTYHRMRGSSQYRAAAEHIRDQLLEYGLTTARIREYPADGKTMFGTQKSRLAWNADSAALWEVDDKGQRLRRLADWESMPLSLAQDSVSGETRTTLVDVGDGSKESDYQGKDVRGELVLVASQPEAVEALAVGKFGAAGIVSYAPNQASAWWKQDDRLVRWGHLSSFPKPGSETFAFMISLGEARALQQRLAKGESIHLDAKVSASRSRGVYSIVEAVIPGSDPAVAAEQIVLTCHLDHPRPGANDNASGCATLLETARSLQRLIATGQIPAPRRSLRFVFPPEIEGSLIYLNAHPDLARRIKAQIHLDMVGGNANTKAVYRISGGPMSLPSFIPDLGRTIGEFVNRQSLAYAGAEAIPGPDARPVDFPLTSPEGGREPLQAEFEGLAMGSDHDVYREGSWRIPGLYLHDWPDRYIHTNFDAADNIDPTKLKRSAFIAGLSAWYLADLGRDDLPELLGMIEQGSLRRAGDLLAARRGKSEADAAGITRALWAYEAGVLGSVADFVPVDAATLAKATQLLDGLQKQLGASNAAPPAEGEQAIVYARNADVRGTMDGFGYGYLADKLGEEEASALALQGAQAYEALNLVNGRRSVAEIRDWMLAEFGKCDAQALVTYLRALEKIGVVRRVP